MEEIKRTMVNDLYFNIDQLVMVKGHVSQIRDLKQMSFCILRERTGYCQIIIPKELNVNLTPESVIEVLGVVKQEKQSKYYGVEIIANSITIISEAEILPFPINREDNVPFNTLYEYRPLTLRKQKERDIFIIQEEIIHLFRNYFRNSEHFIEINSPKLSMSGAEGGSELFNVDYFDNSIYLTQSPQAYKQMMVGVYERVFEIGKIYRAEGSSSNRHLTEFIGLDVEIGFINNVNEIMDLEERCLSILLASLSITKGIPLERLGVNLSKPDKFPRITYEDCLEILKKKSINYDKIGLNSEAEKVIGDYIKETTNSDFVFITNYPLSERPFYAMPNNKENGSETFELLYKGVEITSGGQRIHNYKQLIEAIKNKGLNPDSFESYLMPFKYGMPPHGGFGIGLERFMKQLLNLNTVDEASLIPRTKERFLH